MEFILGWFSKCREYSCVPIGGSLMPPADNRAIRYRYQFENYESKMWIYVNWIQPKMKPKFDKSFLSFQIPECSRYPTVIGQLRFDADYPDALFYLNSAGTPFKIEPGGFLTLYRQLDYEKQRFYAFQVLSIKY